MNYLRVDFDFGDLADTVSVELLGSSLTAEFSFPMVIEGGGGQVTSAGVASVNGQAGVVILDFAAASHEHQPDQIYADAAFVSQVGDSLRIGIYLHNGTDNGRPIYESPRTGDYIWWDSNLQRWYLTSRADLNLFYLDGNSDDFPWETDALWSPISPQTGSIEVDQAFLSDVSDYSSTSGIDLKTAKSGDASSTELVLGNDTRLTNAREATAHTHAIADVDNLQSALDGKQASGSYAPSAHSHVPIEVGLGNVSNIAQVTGVTGTAPISSSG